MLSFGKGQNNAFEVYDFAAPVYKDGVKVGTAHTNYIFKPSDSLEQSVFGYDGGLRMLKRLCEYEGFITEPRQTNPKVSDRYTIGPGISYGRDQFPRFWEQQKAAVGDPDKISELSCDFFSWYTSSMPTLIKECTGMNMQDILDHPNADEILYNWVDLSWHAGRNSGIMPSVWAQVMDGKLTNAVSYLKTTDAYKQSQPARKEAILQSVSALGDYVTETYGILME